MPKPSHLRNPSSDPAPAARDGATRASGAGVESKPLPGKRRTFSAAEKLRIVREAAACTERDDIEALLRREGIYSSLLSAIASTAVAASLPRARRGDHRARESSPPAPATAT